MPKFYSKSYNNPQSGYVLYSDQNGIASWTSSISSALISTTTDITTTNNFTTEKHGFVPIGTNIGSFLRDDGTWASISVSTLNGAVLYVSPTGSDADLTRAGHVGNMLKPFLTIEAARDAALSGDKIHVFPGTYTITTTASIGLSKEGVTYYFEQGCIINKATSGVMFGNTTLPQHILGYGSFYGSGSCGSVFQSIANYSIIEGIIAQSTSSNTFNGTGTYCKISFVRMLNSGGFTMLYVGSHNIITVNEMGNTSGNQTIYAPGDNTIFHINNLSSTGAQTLYHAHSSQNVTFNIGRCTGTIYCASATTLNCGYVSTFTQITGAANHYIKGSFGTINCAGALGGSYTCSTLTVAGSYAHCSPRFLSQGGSATISGGYCELDMDIESNANLSPNLIITGGVTVLKGKWFDSNPNLNSTISAGTLKISGDVYINLSSRLQFITLSGTGIIDLSNSRIHMRTTAIPSGEHVGYSCIRTSGGTIISNGAVITTAGSTVSPIIATAPVNMKVLSGGFNTNRTENGGTIAAKKKKYKFTVTAAANTTVALNDRSGGDETFTALVSGFATKELLAQQMVVLINASGTLDILASQDTPGTDEYFYIEADVAGIDIISTGVTNLTFLLLVDACYAITNVTGGTIIEDVDVLI